MHVHEHTPFHNSNNSIFRIPLIRDGLLNNGQINDIDTPHPLKGMQLLDVGCGGGILSEVSSNLCFKLRIFQVLNLFIISGSH